MGDVKKMKNVMEWVRIHQNQDLTLPKYSEFNFRVIPHVNSGRNLQNKRFLNVCVSFFGLLGWFCNESDAFWDGFTMNLMRWDNCLV